MRSDYETSLEYLALKYGETHDRIETIKFAYEYELPEKEKLLKKIILEICNRNQKLK